MLKSLYRAQPSHSLADSPRGTADSGLSQEVTVLGKTVDQPDSSCAFHHIDGKGYFWSFSVQFLNTAKPSEWQLQN